MYAFIVYGYTATFLHDVSQKREFLINFCDTLKHILYIIRNLHNKKPRINIQIKRASIAQTFLKLCFFINFLSI